MRLYAQSDEIQLEFFLCNSEMKTKFFYLPCRIKIREINELQRDGGGGDEATEKELKLNSLQKKNKKCCVEALKIISERVERLFSVRRVTLSLSVLVPSIQQSFLFHFQLSTEEYFCIKLSFRMNCDDDDSLFYSVRV